MVSVGFVVAWLVEMATSPWFAQVAAGIASLTTLFGAMATWLQRRARWISDRIASVGGLRQRIDARVAGKHIELQRSIRDKETELEVAKARLIAAKAVEVGAQNTVTQAEIELKEASPARLLAKFIQHRVQSDDYTRKLSLLALVRQDFEDLSTYIVHENDKLLSEIDSIEVEREDDAYRVNRIVLYIDDLDRCPVPKVVEVLEAVHLLLALPLFVVVVAVDVRWIQSALATKYRGLLDGRARTSGASPLDYIEKIFQIPYWLNPLDTDGSARLVVELLDNADREVAVAHTANQIGITIGGGEQVSDSSGTQPSEGSAAGQIDTSGPYPGDASVTASVTEAVDLTPSALQLTQEELAFITALSPLLRRSPRAIKRFANIYRLIRASLDIDQESTFLPHSGGENAFETVMFFIALVTNMPAVAEDVFSTIADLRPRNAV